MGTMSDVLREGAGQADATAQLLKGYALQPVAGLGGASRVIMDLLRGRGVDRSMEAGARTVEDIGGWGGGPVTERGAQRLGELGGMVERGTQAVGDALGNPIDKLGSVPVVGPALAASALGFMETANPGKGVARAAKAASSPLVKALKYDPHTPEQALIPGLKPLAREDVQKLMLAEVLRRDPSTDPHASVEAFLKAAQAEPSLLTYGTMPTDARPGLHGMAEAFSKRSGKPIDVEETGGDYYDDDVPYKIEVAKTHGRGEVMRDRYGDYKQDEKTHSRGDYPMYDESGEVKFNEVKGPPVEGEDKVRAKRVALGGEPKRDSYGDQKYEYVKSRGGEPKLDERGNQKYYEKKNPDYYDREPESEGLRLSSGSGSIDIEGYGSGGPASVGAMNASDGGRGVGSLLYQTLLADASRSGNKIGANSLTGDNALRLLNNTLANYARTGDNPRNVTNTASGNRPRARGYATGPEIWEALTGEADARVDRRGGDPSRLQFNGTSFMVDGKPVAYDDIKGMTEDLSPEFRSTLVGPKTLMQAAVYKWLERATPEEAAGAAGEWKNTVKGPIFGKARVDMLGGLAAGTGGAAALINALRNDEEKK